MTEKPWSTGSFTWRLSQYFPSPSLDEETKKYAGDLSSEAQLMMKKVLVLPLYA
jgi:hypothetical protein